MFMKTTFPLLSNLCYTMLMNRISPWEGAMSSIDLETSLTVPEAVSVVEDTLTGAWDGETADSQEIVCKSGRIAVLLFERQAAREKGIQSVLVTVDNLTGATRVHAAKAGGSLGLEALQQNKDAYSLLQGALPHPQAQ
jgi:hypothetical protein